MKQTLEVAWKKEGKAWQTKIPRTSISEILKPRKTRYGSSQNISVTIPLMRVLNASVGQGARAEKLERGRGSCKVVFVLGGWTGGLQFRV